MTDIVDPFKSASADIVDPFAGAMRPTPVASPAPGLKPPSSLLRRVVGDSAVDLTRGVVGLGETVVGLADIPTLGYAGKALERVGFRPAEAKNTIGKLYSPERKEANATVQQAEGFLDTAGAMLTNPSTIAGAAIESVPSILGGGALARALGLAGRAGAFAVGEGAVMAGGAAEQIRQQTPDGLLTPGQAAAAVGTGAVGGALGYAGGRVAAKLGIGDVDVLAAGGQAITPEGQAAKGLVRRTLEGAAVEGVFEEAPQSAAEQAIQNLALGKPAFEGVPEATAAGLLTGAAVGGPVAALSPPKPAANTTTEQPPVAQTSAPNPAQPAAPAGPVTRAVQAIPPQGMSLVPPAAPTVTDGPMGIKLVGQPKPYGDQPVGYGQSPGLVRPAAPTGSVSSAAEALQPAAPDEAGATASITQAKAEGRTADAFTVAMQHNLSVNQAVSLGAVNPANQTIAGASSPGNVNPTTGEPSSPTAPATSDKSGAFKYLLGVLRQGTTDSSATDPTEVATAFGITRREAAELRSEAMRSLKAERATATPSASAGAATEAASSSAGQVAPLPGAEPAPRQYDESPELLDSDIVFDDATPIARREDAEQSARQIGNGAKVFPVAGGFAIRKPLSTGAAAPTNQEPANVQSAATDTATTEPAGVDAGRGTGQPATQPAVVAGTDGAATGSTVQPATDSTAATGNVVAQAANEAATSPANSLPEPTEAQRNAGNFKKGHIRLHGLDISIEHPAGVARKEGHTPLTRAYGYFKGTTGKDKDHVDVFLGENAEDASLPVFVIDQNNKAGRFDEHKTVMGEATEAAAREAYLSNYPKGWKGLGGVTQMTQEQFKAWVKDPEHTKKRATAWKSTPAALAMTNAEIKAAQDSSARKRATNPGTGDIGNPAQNGAPFMTDKAAKAFLNKQDDRDAYGLYRTPKGIVLRPLANDTGRGAIDPNWIDQDAAKARSDARSNAGSPDPTQARWDALHKRASAIGTPEAKAAQEAFENDELDADGYEKALDAADGKKPATKALPNATAPEPTLRDDIADLWEKYDGTGEISSADDLADELENLLDEAVAAPKQLMRALNTYRDEQDEDRDLKGRNDMDTAEDAFTSAIRSWLAETPAAGKAATPKETSNEEPSPAVRQDPEARAEESTAQEGQQTRLLTPEATTETPPTGGVSVSAYPKVITKKGKPIYVPHDRQSLEAYFQPGTIVQGYGGPDKVLSFHWNGPDSPREWSVKVIRVDAAGNPVKGEEVRNHSTQPDPKDYVRVFGPAKMPAKKAAPNKRDAREIENALFRELTSDLEMAGKTIEDIANEIRSRTADSPLSDAAIEKLAKAAVKELKGKADALEKEKHRSPAVYKESLANAVADAYPGARAEPLSQEAHDAFVAGWDHALKGKTKSTMAGEHLAHMLLGYAAAQKWMKTEAGRAWYEGKPVAKLENTGADLRRWYEQQKAKMLADRSSGEKLWDMLTKSTVRADLFPITPADDATPGVTRFLDHARSETVTFLDYFANWTSSEDNPFRTGPNASAGTPTFYTYRGRYHSSPKERAIKFLDRVMRAEDGDFAGNIYIVDKTAPESEWVEDTRDKSRKHLPAKLATADSAREIILGVAAQYMDDVRLLRELLQVAKTAAAAAEIAKIMKQHSSANYDRLLLGTMGGKSRYSDPLLADKKYADAWAIVQNDNVPLAEGGDRAKPLTPPRLDHVTRTGMKDHRGGKSVTPQQFKETFGFADVGFGKWVNAKQDQDHLNYAYDAFMDLAKHFGIDPKMIGGGKIHFTIGALGHGKFAAHFAPQQPHPDGGKVPVINVTNTKGDGTVYHEWGHAFDMLLAKDGWSKVRARVLSILKNKIYGPEHVEANAKRFMFDGWYFKGMRSRGNDVDARTQSKVRMAMQAMTFYNMQKYAGPTSYYVNAEKLDAGKSSKDAYWSNNEELIARSVEAWVVDTLPGVNTYLVNPAWAGNSSVTAEKGYRGAPYPQDDERKVFVSLWNAVKASVKEKDGALTVDVEAFESALPKEWTAGEFRRKELETYENMLALYQEELAKREEIAEAKKSKDDAKKAAEEAEADRIAAETLAAMTANAAPPPASATMGPPSDDDLSALFDEAAAELREDTQEKPDAPAPGEAVAELADYTPPSDEKTWNRLNYSQREKLAQAVYGGMRPVVHRIAGSRWDQLGEGEHQRMSEQMLKTREPNAVLRKPAATEKPGLSDKQEKTAKALAAEAAKQGVTGMDEALKGLVKLFGGGPGRLNSFPAGFDEDAYKQAKPHFEAALKAFQAAGKSLKDLFKFLIQNFGDGIKMYALQFAKDQNLDVNLGQSASATSKVADYVVDSLQKTADITWRDLFAAADKAFGGTQAEGKYTPKDAYDAMEAGINRFIAQFPSTYTPQANAEGAGHIIAALERMMARLPTQTKRTKEMDKFQQFSTVPPFAFVANWVANINNQDVMLEPSAGIGGLAVFAKNAGAQLVLNELSARRAAVLQEVFPAAKVFRENAEQIDNILPDSIVPSVVVMNPPFSNSAVRGATKDTAIGAQHVEQALNRLAPGGRLVAIVGQGMSLDSPTFKAWWGKIRAKHDVRAVVPVDGSGYAKYGTTFDNVLLVIDKVAPKEGRQIVTTPAKAYNELVGILTEIRNDRPSPEIAVRDDSGTEQNAAESARSEPVAEGGSASGTGATDPAGAAGVGDGKPVPKPTDRGNGVRSGGARNGDGPGSGVRQPGGPATAAGDNAGGSGNGAGFEPVGSSGRAESSGLTISSEQTEAGELTDSVFENYLPQKLRVPGAKPHPGELVQSAAMASVQPPDPTYVPNLPAETIEKGLLSIAQIESVVYAGQAHEQILPEGERRGFFIGDGTGVGKGREIAGILLDNMRRGRKKAVWVSEKQPLMNDAKRDFKGVGGDDSLIFNQNKTGAEAAIEAGDGIIFTTYSTLRSGAQSVDTNKKGKDEPPAKKKAGQSRLDQLANWLGKDFDGVIVFDEAHNAGNAVPVKGVRGNTEPSAQALAVVELQKKLPKARVVYVSATGAATQVANLSYATRLGLWGKDTPFASVMSFIADMMAGGLATMELVARDMKQMGAYLARSLSFNGVSYSRIEHELDPLQTDIYNRLAEAWQVTLQNFDKALEVTGAKTPEGKSANKSAVSAAKSAFWGAQQRFFNQIITSMQMPSVIAQMERDLANGDALVLQLVNTNEAQLERALTKRKGEEESEDLEDLDLTPRDQLIQLVEKSFPVAQMEETIDANGKKTSSMVMDSEGRPVLNKEAVRMRDKLLEDLKAIRVPDGPLEMLLNHFGPDIVAEVTGRKQRVVRKPNDDGEVVAQIEKRGSAAARSDADSFMADKKRILIFSDAGGTGFSFHADLTKANQRKRKHYLIQPGWRADKAVQGFGRTHRTNQKSAPHYYLAATNIPAHKRFLSSIARRLDQLGALTKGQRDTANQGLFSEKDNLESKYAQQAVRQFLEDLQGGQFESEVVFQSGDVVTSPTKPGQEFVVVKDEGGPRLTLRLPDGTESIANRAYLNGAKAGLNFKEFLRQMGLENLVNPETGKIAEKDFPQTSQFLNRMLSLKLDMQELVFAAFMARMEEKVEVAIQRGELDTGIETIKAIDVNVASDDVIYTDPRTKAETKFIELDLTQANTFYPLPDVRYQGGKTEWVVNASSGRVWLKVNSGTKTDEKTGAVYTKYRMMGTGGTAIRDERDFKAKMGASPYRTITAEEAAQLWQKENEARPATVQRKAYMISGALLPIWDRLKTDSKMRVARTQTTDGRRLLGRLVMASDVEEVRSRFQITSAAAKLSVAEVLVEVLKGKEAKLANGWVIKRAMVSGELRIEIANPRGGIPWPDAKLLVSDGVITERIEWKDRYFIPTGATGYPIAESIFRSKPVNDIVDPKAAKSSDEPGEAMFSRPADNLNRSGRGFPQTSAQVKDAIGAITRKWGNGPKVVVLDSAAGLPTRADGWQTAEGMYDPNTGTVYLVAPNLKNPNHARTVLIHESVGHFGVEAITGAKEWADIGDIVRKMADSPKFADLFNELERRGYKRNAPEFVQEAVAVMAEKGVRNAVMDRVVAAFRRFLRSIGFTLDMSERDLRQHIVRATKHLERGNLSGSLNSSPGLDTVGAMRSNRPDTFYSAMLEAITASTSAPKKGDPGQWKGWMNGAIARGEFKQAERDWLGVDAWLSGRKSTTRDELAAFVRDNQVQVEDVVLGGGNSEANLARQRELMQELGKKYGIQGSDNGDGTYDLVDMDDNPADINEYPLEANELFAEWERLEFAANETGGQTKFGPDEAPTLSLPGGTNYRELLLTLPERGPTAEDIIERDGRLDANNKGEIPPAFLSSHYPQPNILAHVRFNERTDADGKRVLFIEEIQSDYGQSMRKSKLEVVRQVKADFDGIVQRMKNAGVLTVECD